MKIICTHISGVKIAFLSTQTLIRIYVDIVNHKRRFPKKRILWKTKYRVE